MVDAEGSSGFAVQADISRRADCDAMVAAAIGQFGGLDILYNNAAVQMSGRLVDTTEEEWDLTIATNLDAVFWACRAALPYLVESGNGSIISTASVLGLIGSEGYAAYGAREGRARRARCARSRPSTGPQVRANVIAPGSIDTPRFRKVAETMPGGPDKFLDGAASRRSRCTGSAPPTTSPASRCSSRRTSRRTRPAR